MKILYVTTIGATMSFFQSFIKELIDEGHTVDIATNDSVRKVPDCYKEFGCRIFTLSCSRSPVNKGNWNAIAQIRRLVAQEKYELVHCHTPIAAACTRIACRKLRKTQGVKVFYTAHGFHFYKGAPLKNWLLFYPIEKYCSYFTNVLITINQEDYQQAQKKMNAVRVEYVPGVGVDVAKFRDTQVNRNHKRNELGIPAESIMLLSVGELNKNKNQQVIIRALAQLEELDIHYAVVGKGDQSETLKKLSSKLGVAQRVHFLGYRQDVAQLYHVADIFCHPSFREGLPVSMIEAMACGLPCVASRTRGNTDLVDLRGGMLFDPFDAEDCAKAISTILQEDMSAMGQYNSEKSKEFASSYIVDKMKVLYQQSGCDD